MKLSGRTLMALVVGMFLLAAIATPAFSAGFKIGFVFSMTGGAAVYGTSQKEGASLAVDQINAAAGSGLQIVPVFEDDASVPQQGTNVFNKLINGDKVPIIIGPTLSNTAKTTDPIAQAAGVPVLAISNTISGITEIGNYIFRDSLTEDVVIPHTVKFAKEKLGIKKVAILYGNDDAMTKATYEVFKKVLQSSGIQILGEQTFAKGDRDFSPQLTQIKAQNPDAIILGALAEEASGIISQARTLGIPKTVRIIGGNGLNSPGLIKNAGEAAEGVIVGAAWNVSSTAPLNVKFVNDYTKKYNHAPDQFGAQAFAGVQIAYQAVKAAGGGDRKAIRDALAKIKNLDTVLGRFSFTEGRDAQHAGIVQEIKGGKFVVLGNLDVERTVNVLLQQLINGLFIGCVYGLFAVGYTLVFGVLDILNLAHAAIFTLGGLIALWLVESAGLSIWLAFPLGTVAAGLLGLLLNQVAFAPLRKRSDSQFSGLISSIAMAIIFEAGALGLFGARAVRFPVGTVASHAWQIGGLTITSLQVGIVCVAASLMVILTLFIGRTRTGKAIRAIGESERAATLLGINVNGVIAFTFFVSSALGGAAGILFGLYFNNLTPDMGRSIELKGLAVIILGGMGSIPGAILGGLAFGLSEVLTVAISGTSNLRDAVAFAVLFAILLIRPSGLLGRGRIREA